MLIESTFSRRPRAAFAPGLVLVRAAAGLLGHAILHPGRPTAIARSTGGVVLR